MITVGSSVSKYSGDKGMTFAEMQAKANGKLNLFYNKYLYINNIL